MRERKTRSILPVTAMAILAAVAVWQFYAFATFRNVAGTVDLQGGRQHLWWAIGFAVSACVAAFFVFSAAMRYDTTKEMHITSPPSGREPIL